MTNSIYLDNASTTCLDPRVKAVMDVYFTEVFGNPSSSNSFGVRAKTAVESSRNTVASVLKCLPEEVFFTSGGTESINLALQGVAKALTGKGKHIITSKIEHPAVLNTCRYLETEGFEVTYLTPDKYGRISPEQVENEIRKTTILVSIMYANNEVGTINPIEQIGLVTRKYGIYLHTDACQASGFLDLDVTKLNVDLMTLNGSKIYGPKGTGVLFVRRGVEIKQLFYGGGQEKGVRSGTENVPGIVGFAKALQLSYDEQDNEKLLRLRNKLSSAILNKIPSAVYNGHSNYRLPNNVNISFPGVEGEAIVQDLDKEGFSASTGSACTSKHIEPSHVITGLGKTYAEAVGSVRFTIGRQTTEEDINRLVDSLIEIISRFKGTIFITKKV